MRRLFLLFAILVALFGAGSVSPPVASAHDLSCDKARELAGHPNAYCRVTSPNHKWLYFPWRSCQEHVYWSHYCDGPFCGLHQIVIVHCASWH